MRRFISPNTNLHTKCLTITDPKEIHHLVNVLRLQKGHKIIIFNGQGQEALAEIQTITPRSIGISIVSTVKKLSESRITLTLACAIPKKTKFETIIEKCTELGVDCMIPMITERTEVRLTQERQEKKYERYKTVAVNAAKQCQRNFLPDVLAPKSFKDVLRELSPSDAAFIPCLTGERKNLLEIFSLGSQHNNVIFFIGPEGDFTPKELKDALLAGCIPVSLGPHVLKVDTAALAAMACAKLLLGKICE